MSDDYDYWNDETTRGYDAVERFRAAMHAMVGVRYAPSAIAATTITNADEAWLNELGITSKTTTNEHETEETHGQQGDSGGECGDGSGNGDSAWRETGG